MGLIAIPTKSRGTTEGLGTQRVLGTLTITPGFVIEFDASVFRVAGKYALFSYGSLVGDPNLLVADPISLQACGFTRALFSSSGATNGTVYVTVS